MFTEADPSGDDSDVIGKVRRYYASCMDVNKTKEQLGAKPLLDILKTVSSHATSFLWDCLLVCLHWGVLADEWLEHQRHSWCRVECVQLQSATITRAPHETRHLAALLLHRRS